MDAIALADVDAGNFSKHRGDGIAFRRLMHGEVNTPGNYEWSVIDVGPEYDVPRHRHDFEQVQLVLSGEHAVTPKLSVKEGRVAYYPEGTWYGPMQGSGSVILHLQLGGPSGAGFLAYDQVGEASATLANSGRGEFSDGIWRFVDDEGKRRNIDAYEAISIEARGRKPVYPKARYETPILMDPEAFDWHEIAPGVCRRHLATFHERGLSVEFLRIDAGNEHEIAGRGSDTLAFVTAGKVGVADEVFGPETALRFPAGDPDRVVRADAAAELFVIGMPVFS